MIIDTDTLVKIHVEYDHDAESPEDWNDYELVSFCTRHRHFKQPTDEFIQEVKRRVEQGTAFWLDCYQHGQTHWSRSGHGPQCQFDTARQGGVLFVPENETVSEKQIDWFLDTFNNWANGHVYYYYMKQDDETIDGCGSYYDWESILDDVIYHVKHHEVKQVMLKGEALHMVEKELREACKELNVEIVDL